MGTRVKLLSPTKVARAYFVRREREGRGNWRAVYDRDTSGVDDEIRIRRRVVVGSGAIVGSAVVDALFAGERRR